MFRRIWDLFRGDSHIKVCILILMVMSAIFVFSSTSPLSYKTAHDTSNMLFSHLSKMLLSCGVLYVFSRIPANVFIKFVNILYVVSILMLALVYVIGQETNGASRWLQLGPLTIQPSEFAKIILIVSMAKGLSASDKNYLRLFIASALVIGMIFVENGSTGFLLFVSAAFMVVISDCPIKIKPLLIAIVSISLIAVFLVKFDLLPRLDTWIGRFVRFFSGEGDIQADYAQVAVASGGFFGVGPGQGDMKNFLPVSFADYIFAIILEEGGLLSMVFVIGPYFWMFKRIRDYAFLCKMKFEAYVLMGLGFMYTFQAVFHMWINVGMGPVTGQTLPLVSWGGTSGVFVCMAYGIILSITHDVKQTMKIDLDNNKTKI